MDYTNIDYLAYSQQAALFLPPNNVRDYSSLRGDTGPLVYPALHLYIYSFLHKRFPAASSPDVGGFVPGKVGSGLEAGTAAMQPDGRRSLLVLQWMWAGVYLATLVAVAWIYRQAIRSLEKQVAAAQKKATEDERGSQVPANVEQSLFKLLFGTSPPLQPFLIFLPLSKRLHSIYVLRLFNDPLAMLALYASVVLFCKKKWYLGAIVYSYVCPSAVPSKSLTSRSNRLALGIKMNILLFLPGLLVLLFQYKGLRGTILVVCLIITIQASLFDYYSKVPLLTCT
ncbi:hypothetical protein QFC22_001472 [Naganishia vaughanmartiniae]|uniref:Uncharacterized protein n=1 Tax=Naganishia vaughanmartiniae TaxID=1424756 RepID=A0ACC2XIM3_9TREE|nr:hypothetical protein QFC22_001472 [Naganishia vaughanmartiniae]